jgi:RND family efflux transporter MFP subunit
VFTVTQLDKVRVRVALPERDAPLADVGDPAKLTFQALPGQVFEGHIARTASVLDRQTRTMMVEIDLENSQQHLLPGMFGQATITLTPAIASLTLPANTVRFDEKGNSYVYVVDARNEVAVVDVEVGLDDGSQLQIIAGLDGDEKVVAPVLRRLRAGQKVSTES